MPAFFVAKPAHQTDRHRVSRRQKLLDDRSRPVGRLLSAMPFTASQVMTAACNGASWSEVLLVGHVVFGVVDARACHVIGILGCIIGVAVMRSIRILLS